MNRRNEGISESDILQNQFTAYLQTSLQHCKSQYLSKLEKQRMYETEMPQEHAAIEEDFGDTVAKNVTLLYAMKQIKTRDRLVVTLHAAEGKSFKEIAVQLDMKYSSVTMVYYRTLDKLRIILQEDDNGF